MYLCYFTQSDLQMRIHKQNSAVLQWIQTTVFVIVTFLNKSLLRTHISHLI